MGKTAIVLSGGGSRGAFQIGALQYLYKERQIAPRVFCGTSVGSLHAAKLSEVGHEAQHRAAREQGVDDLEGVWRGLVNSESMYVPTRWLQNHSAAKDIVLRHLTPLGAVEDEKTAPMHFYLRLLQAAPQLVEFFQTQTSIFALDPVRNLLGGMLSEDRIRRSGNELRLAVTCLDTGTLRYVTESGKVLERDNRTPVLGGPLPLSSAHVPAPCRALYADVEAQSGVVDALAQQLAEAAADERYLYTDSIWREQAVLEAKVAEYQECAAIQPGIVPIVDGVLASAAVPAIFEPISLLGQTYVDGGILEVLPVNVAAALGADEIYCISASSSTVVPTTKPMNNIPAILERAMVDLTLNEIGRDEFELEVAAARVRQKSTVTLPLVPTTLPRLNRRVARPAPPIRLRELGIWAIEPRIDTYSITDVLPYFIDITIGYGYMRASDVVENVHHSLQITAEAIVRARIDARRTNFQRVYDPNEKKAFISSLVEQRRRLGLKLPPDADGWADAV